MQRFLTVIHAAEYLLPHPLGDVNKPQSIDTEEGVVEPTLQNTNVKVINCDPRL
jgi:hypothetical protein